MGYMFEAEDLDLAVGAAAARALDLGRQPVGQVGVPELLARVAARVDVEHGADLQGMVGRGEEGKGS